MVDYMNSAFHAYPILKSDNHAIVDMIIPKIIPPGLEFLIPLSVFFNLKGPISTKKNKRIKYGVKYI